MHTVLEEFLTKFIAAVRFLLYMKTIILFTETFSSVKQRRYCPLNKILNTENDRSTPTELIERT